MRRYRDEFGKTSAEIGVLFGVAESTVRNKMRLLDLPEPVQARVAERTISEGVARGLLTAQRLVPERVEAVAEELVEGKYESPEQASSRIRNTIENAPGVKKMWSSWLEGEPRGGSGLWPLAWDPKVVLPAPSVGVFEKAFPAYAFQDNGASEAVKAELEKTHERYLKNALRQVHLAMEAGDGDDRDWTAVSQAYDLADDFVRDAALLIMPPACTKCEHYARMDGNHFCGVEACWGRKKGAWIDHELAQKVEKLGIPIYDPEMDGKYYEELTPWADEGPWKAWLEEGAEHLRLRANVTEYSDHALTQSRVVQLVSVREAEEKKTQGITDEDEQERKLRVRHLTRSFLENQASLVFGQAFEGLPLGVLEDLGREVVGRYHLQDYEIPEDETAAVEFWKQMTAYYLIWHDLDWDDLERGAMALAADLVERAERWGVELPEGWLVMAVAYEPDVADAPKPEVAL